MILREQDKDLLIQWDMVCRKLRESGKDLSGIRISMKEGAVHSYLTKRILAELEEAKHES